MTWHRRFKWTMGLAIVAALVAIGYAVRRDRLPSQNGSARADMRPNSTSGLAPATSSNLERSELARATPVATGDDVRAQEAEPVVRTSRGLKTAWSSNADAYKRFGDVTPEYLAWLKRNKYPDDAHQALLRAMDEASLRTLVAQRDLAAQSELAYRLSRNPETAPESADLFMDAIAKGSKEAIVRNAESLEQASRGCTNNVQGNAYLQVAAILGDLNAAARYSLCVDGMSSQDHTLTLLIASKLFATLNTEALRRTGRPLQVDTHPLMDQTIDQIETIGNSNNASGG